MSAANQNPEQARDDVAALSERQQALVALCADGGCDLASAAAILEIPIEEARRDLVVGQTFLSAHSLPGRQECLPHHGQAPASLCEALDLALPGAPCAQIPAERPGAAPLQLKQNRPARIWAYRAVAAILMVGVVGLGAWWLRGDGNVARVESGHLRVDGQDNALAPTGAHVENAESVPAVLRLDGDSRITLEPSTVLRMSPASSESVGVELESGQATVLCSKRKKPLAVRTVVGDVFALDAQFTVDLTANNSLDEGGDEMKRHSLILAVAVLAGSVSVNYDGAKVSISAGGSRIFAAEGKDGGDVVKPKGDKVDKFPSQDVPLADLPGALVDAAQVVAPGIQLTSAKMRQAGASTEYQLEGTVGDVTYDVRISANPSKKNFKGDGAPKGDKVKGDPAFIKGDGGDAPVKKVTKGDGGDAPAKTVKGDPGDAPVKKVSKGDGGDAPVKKVTKGDGGDAPAKTIKGDAGDAPVKKFNKGDGGDAPVKKVIKGDGGDAPVKKTKGDAGDPPVKKGTKVPDGDPTLKGDKAPTPFDEPQKF